MRHRSARKWHEATIMSSLFVLAASSGALYYIAIGALPAGSAADWFGPSAMWAAGRGFVVPMIESKEWAHSPETLNFRQFLDTKKKTLDLTDIPPDIRTAPAGAFHHIHCYLFYSVAIVWRILGIHWSMLAIPIGLMVGLSAIAAYTLFRLAMGRLTASVCVAVFILLPSHLGYAPNIRDYGKAPFIMVALAIIAYLVTHPVTRRRVLCLSALLGLDIGIGLGFRFDLVLMLFVATLVILCGLPCGMRKHVRLRAGALCLLCLCFAIPAWPILKSIAGEQDVEPLHIMEGLAPPFDDYLGVGGVPYRLIGLYNDALAYDTAVEYAYRVQGVDHQIPYCNDECTHASRSYLMAYVRHFPADVVVRALAATLRVLQYAPMQVGVYARPLPHVYTAHILPWLIPLLMHLRMMGPWYMGGLLLFVAIRHLRAGLIALAFVLYLGAYSSLQFDPRHTFHLAFLPVMSLGVLVEQSLLLVYRLARPKARATLVRRWRRRGWVEALARIAILVGLGVWLTVMPLFVARWYQERHLGDLYQTYLQAERAPLSVGKVTSKSPSSTGDLYQPQDVFAGVDTGKHCLNSVYLCAELSGNGLQVSAYPCYRTTADFNNYSRAFECIDLSGTGPNAPVHFFFPVFSACPSDLWGRRDFDGLCVSSSPNVRLLSMSRIQSPSTLPFLMSLKLPPDWKTAARYQTLKPGRLPDYLCKELVSRNSVLVDGGFEWWEDDNTPRGFSRDVSTSAIVREEQTVAQGRYAARQTWQQPDGACAISTMFYAGIANLEPMTRYGLRVKALNLSEKGSAAISVWQRTDTPGQSPRMVCIAPGLITVAPGEGFQDLYGAFTTWPGEHVGVFLVTSVSASVPRDAFPVSVVWDDWNLAPLPE